MADKTSLTSSKSYEVYTYLKEHGESSTPQLAKHFQIAWYNDTYASARRGIGDILRRLKEKGMVTNREVLNPGQGSLPMKLWKVKGKGGGGQ